jgi:hypothetical protein
MRGGSVADFVKQSFTFTGERRLNTDFFEKPILGSAPFRKDTVSMLVALLAGTFVLCWYWRALPLSARILIIGALLCLPSLWLRTVADHRMLRNRLSGIPRTGIPPELLVRASGVQFGGPSLLYAFALILFLALGFTIHYYQHLFYELRTSLRAGP